MAKGITDGDAVKLFLRTVHGRITSGDAWLVPGYRGHWCVYRHPYRARKTETLYDGDSFQAALAVMGRDGAYIAGG